LVKHTLGIVNLKDVRVDPPADPVSNMEKDLALVARVRNGETDLVWRIYRWDREAISLGRRQVLEDLPLDWRKKGLPWVRRPTGGGAVLHTPSDITYAVAIARNAVGGFVRDLPKIVHQRLREGLIALKLVPAEELQLVWQDPPSPSALCFTSLAHGDLIHRGCKIAGAAIRVWREAVLMQGSLAGFPSQWADAIPGLIHQAILESFCGWG
jgi:lipoate-protein ligase A